MLVFLSLDINVFREKVKILTNVYENKTSSGVRNNFNLIPETYGTVLIKSLLFRCFIYWLEKYIKLKKIC